MHDSDYIGRKKFINGIITKISISKFNSIDDITLENLREFLIPIFEGFGEGRIDHSTFWEIGDNLEIYIHRKYGNLYPDTEYPIIQDSDARSIGLEAVEYMSFSASKFFMLPEDIPHFCDFLRTHAGKEVQAHKKLKGYVSQIDSNKRSGAIIL